MAVKAPPGMAYVKQPNGKYRLVKTPGAKGATSPAKATPKPVTADPYVANEIQRQVNQDAALTSFADTQTGDISKTMADQAAEASRIAAQYAPTTAYANPTLDANAQHQLAGNLALTNAVGSDQQKALAALIARTGSAGTDLMANQRAAGQQRHVDYSRYLEGLRPTLEANHAKDIAAQKEAAQQMALQNEQMRLAQQQFGLSATTAKDQSDQAWAQIDQKGTEAAAVDPKTISKYGFGLNSKYDPGIDSLYGQVASKTVPKIDPATGKPMVGANGKPVLVANPARRWRDVVSKLTGLGVNGGQAVLLASKWLPERLRVSGKDSPYTVYRILKSGELGFKVSDNVAKQVLANIGPNAWARRNSAPKRAATTDLLGDALGNIPGSTATPAASSSSSSSSRPPKPTKDPHGNPIPAGAAWVWGGPAGNKHWVYTF